MQKIIVLLFITVSLSCSAQTGPIFYSIRAKDTTRHERISCFYTPSLTIPAVDKIQLPILNSIITDTIKLKHTMIFLNPGSEPVESGTLEQARKNIKAFINDLPMGGIKRTYTGKMHSGRFLFRLRKRKKIIEISMPGLPLDKVRFIGDTYFQGNLIRNSAWDYPRLFVDGSSWLWMYATRIVTREFR